MRRRSAVTGAIAAAALTFFALAGNSAEIPRRPEPPTPIEVRAVPITAFEPRDPSRQRFGALEYRGGLVLTSPYRQFGGISAIRVGADGASFLTVSDIGRWWRGRIVYDGKRPVGIGEKPNDRWTVPLSHSLHVGDKTCQHASDEKAWWDSPPHRSGGRRLISLATRPWFGHGQGAPQMLAAWRPV